MFSSYDLSKRSAGTFDHDLLLFTVATESLSRISTDRITVIGGRSAHGLALPGKSLSDIIDIPDTEVSLLTDSFYKIREKAAVIPLEDKILVIYNRLLRSNGLGVAFIFDYSPRCASAILSERSFDSIAFSNSFYKLSEKQKGAMEFLSSLSFALETLERVAFPVFSDMTSDAKTILDAISLLSDLVGCPVSSSLNSISTSDLTLDRPTLTTFLLCLFSEARRLSRDRRAEVTLSFERSFKISLGFTISSEIDLQKHLSESGFCDRMAEEMGIPFGFETTGDICRASFIPFRRDPSLMGFKAGIFIDGKRFIRRI